MKKIGFNKPYLSGNELNYIQRTIDNQKLSGNGYFTKKCQTFFEEKYDFKKCLLTSSCTDALEMASILMDIKAGDEVIVPSYTFVSSANAFVLRGAKIVFCDSYPDHPNINHHLITDLINERTKAIVVVHYAGIACEMDSVMDIAIKNNLFVVEDAAQSIDSFYNDSPLGGIGHFGTFSFHETKNIQCGEGGMLVINDDRYVDRAEIIWEKGTNRGAFYRGEVDKYGWVDVGSSFLPSEVTAAFLWAQLECLEDIQNKRKYLWNLYFDNLISTLDPSFLKLPMDFSYSTNNAHMFYLLTCHTRFRTLLIDELRNYNIHSVFHYLSLEGSHYYKSKHDGRLLANSELFANNLLRLPLYYELEDVEVLFICNKIIEFQRFNFE